MPRPLAWAVAVAKSPSACPFSVSVYQTQSWAPVARWRSSSDAWTLDVLPPRALTSSVIGPARRCGDPASTAGMVASRKASATTAPASEREQVASACGRRWHVAPRREGAGVGRLPLALILARLAPAWDGPNGPRRPRHRLDVVTLETGPCTRSIRPAGVTRVPDWPQLDPRQGPKRQRRGRWTPSDGTLRASWTSREKRVLRHQPA